MTIRWLALACAFAGVCVAIGAQAASPVVNETVAIVDPTTPAQQAGVTTSGALKVDTSAGGTGAVNVSQFGGNGVVTGTGTGGNGIPRVTVSSDSAITQGTAAALGGAWPAKITDGTTAAAVTAASTAPAASDPAIVAAISPNGADPCMNPSVAKSSAAIDISSATTTALVAASASKVVYVCGFSVTAAGTNPTLKFEYGTGGTCGSGTTATTGTYAPTAGTHIAYASGGMAFSGAASNEICAVTGGTPSVQGVLTYVQQ